jgi:hypothetical protein
VTSGNTGKKTLSRKGDQTRTEPAEVKIRTGGAKAKYPWDEVESAFIEGIARSEDGMERTYLNLKDLAEHFDIPYQRVKERSASKRWTERRLQAQTELEQARQKSRQRELVKGAVEFDEKALSVAKIGIGLVQSQLAQIAGDLRAANERVADARRRMEAGEKVEKWELYSAVNYREMEGLSRAAETFQNIGRRALGTDGEKLDINVEGNIEHAVSVSQELQRDDAERLASMLVALERAGLAMGTPGGTPELESADRSDDENDYEGDDDEVVEAEIVDEDSSTPSWMRG